MFDSLGTAWLHVRVLSLAAPMALASLVSIGAAGLPHWLARWLVVLAAVMSFAPIGAYEPAIFLAMSLPLISLIVMSARRWAARAAWPDPVTCPPAFSFRFNLRDLLLLPLLVGLVVSSLLLLSAHLRRIGPIDGLVAAMSLMVLACLTYASAFARHWKTSLLLLGIFIAADALLLSQMRFGVLIPIWQLLGNRVGTIFERHEAVIGLLLVELALMMIAPLWLVKITTSPDRTPTAGLMARLGLCILAVVTAVPLSWLYVQMLWPLSAPTRPKGDGNRYDEILALAGKLEQLNPVTATGANLQEVKRLSAEALRLVDSPSFLPVLSASSLSLATQTTQWELYLDLDREAFDAITADDIDRAITYTIAVLHYGAIYRRGGAIYSNGKGMNIEWAALRHFAKMRHRLDDSQARTIIAALQRQADGWDAPASTLAIEWADLERRFGWAARLDHALHRLLGTSIHAYFEPQWKRHAALNAMLRIDLAIHMFQRDQGRLPETLDELAPAYVNKLPLDPFSGQPFRYEPQEKQFELYSVGHDGEDNGGHFADILTYKADRGYDLDLKTITPP
jgi:hypothetical protein